MRKRYPSDISKEQFKKIESMLLGARKITKPRKHNLYDIFCAVLYLKPQAKGRSAWFKKLSPPQKIDYLKQMLSAYPRPVHQHMVDILNVYFGGPSNESIVHINMSRQYKPEEPLLLHVPNPEEGHEDDSPSLTFHPIFPMGLGISP